MARVLSALVVLLLIATPCTAIARAPQTNAPPGNSAIDEYLETVPGATGNQRPRQPGAAGGSSNATLTPTQRARLERLGADGKTLADAVDATAPAAASRTSTPLPLTAGGGSPLSEVLDVAAGRDGGAGMGALLPAILVATLVGVIALVVVRRRSVS
ncbi:MAG: hypothetical protein QOG94_2909 [Solirubrobacteraceae bacterium]|jgi:hypothetical protein|nr:hypothetical protein [Solirubrobacteraceae bacterium]